MAKKSKSQRNMTSVPEEVRQFLSQNGKKGGQATKRLIDAGKKALNEE